MSLDTLPPHDEAAEAGALGCVVYGNAHSDRLLDRLNEEDFYDLRHKTIFRALLSLQFDNAELNGIALGQRLRDQNQTIDAGGESYINSLPDRTPSPANFPTYLETVRDRTERRRLLQESRHLQARALDTSKPVQVNIDAEQLEQCRFDHSKTPPELRPVYTLAGVPVSTPQNLTNVTSQAKGGKSALVGAAVASATTEASGSDLLGFESSNPSRLAICWFDSEQSPDDFWFCVDRSMRRAGQKRAPANLAAYCFTGKGYKRAWRMVIDALRASADKHSGVHSIILDGAADFVADVNDSEESNDFVAELHGLAIEYDCPIVSIIHLNPGKDTNTKSRGHLGSQLERKGETNLVLEKDKNGVTTIFSTKNRRAPIPKSTGPKFAWSAQHNMHVLVQSDAERLESERKPLSDLAESVFSVRPSMNRSDLESTVKKRLKVSESSAYRKVTSMLDLGVIKKGTAGLYVSTCPIDQKCL